MCGEGDTAHGDFGKVTQRKPPHGLSLSSSLSLLISLSLFPKQPFNTPSHPLSPYHPGDQPPLLAQTAQHSPPRTNV
jgi:hypothetical protein